MKVDYDALKYITGYDLTSEESLKSYGIESVSLMLKEGDQYKLILKKFNNDNIESYSLNYEPYYQYIRKIKLQKIINKINKINGI